MTVDILDTKYTDIAFDGIGVRNSQKRLAGLILDLAVMPLRSFQDELRGEFDIVQSILARRTAAVIGYWCQNKHDPVKPSPTDMMSDITNASKNDVSLETFFINEVHNGLHRLAPQLDLDIPDGFTVATDELEYALMTLEEQIVLDGDVEDLRNGFDFNQIPEYIYGDDEADDAGADAEALLDDQPEFDLSILGEHTDVEELMDMYGVDVNNQEDLAALAELVAEAQASELGKLVVPSADPEPQPAAPPRQRQRRQRPAAQATEAVAAVEVQQAQPAESNQRAIMAAQPQQINDIVAQQQQVQAINTNVLNITAEQAWQLVYGMMGYPSTYIQQTMLPRWQQFPQAFEKDRRYLYQLFLESIKNAAGVTYIAGNFTFADRNDLTLDQLWNFYFTDLSQNIAPQLTAARLEAEANDPAWKKTWQRLRKQVGNISPIWMVALAIALVFDGLTTYVSLDQTPMEGIIVPIFTVLITALFQIADQLVINYRQREAEADAIVAKYKARYAQLSKAVEGLDEASDSYVQLSMQKSETYANFKAAEDNRKMARRGRYWSARIADINVIVTAYGFAFLFLNSQEPVYALVEQIDFIFFKGAWESVNLWVFLMVVLAITVSFVVNTAQRTEVLGWSMRRLKNEA